LVRAACAAALLVLGQASGALAQPVQPSLTWLRTERETALWSGPRDPAEQFSIVPPGTYMLRQDAPADGRVLVYFPGDGQARLPGQAWLAAPDVAPSGPPPWLATSELDGIAALPPSGDGPRRVAYLAPPDVSAPEVAVVDETSGRLLYGRAAHAREAPASTTKIATALVALDRAESLDARLPITVDGWSMAIADGSSIMGLVPGARLSVRTLLYGLLLPSGNDAAEQFARGLTESRAEFIAAMNARVAELGLRDTHFVNPTGLDAPNHYASAYDLAHLARTAMRDATFREIVGSAAYTAEGFELRGHNPLLGVYPATDGVKTGTTDQAGKAMVASVVHDGHRVYVVVMHSDDLLADCSALFDWAWAAFGWPPTPQ
jgi:D-alanyl-D-alanine carboxypeptidase